MKLRVNVDDDSNVFFISDFHLFHKNVIAFDKRPFLTPEGEPDVEAMHTAIVSNWNSVVTSKDTVFYLGDLCFTKWQKAEPIVNKLNGKIHFIMGNHDKYEDIKNYKKFLSINDYVDLTIKSSTDVDYHFALMHYPIFSHNRMHHGSFHIHGHTHGNIHHGEGDGYYTNRRAIDVGCNLIDYTPISYKSVIDEIDKNLVV